MIQVKIHLNVIHLEIHKLTLIYRVKQYEYLILKHRYLENFSKVNI